MKLTHITHIIIILLAFGCDRYDELSDAQQQNFTKYYGIGLEDEGVGVIETSDGYVVMANVDNGNNRQDIALIRTDKYGNTLGPITMIGGEYDDAGNVIKEYDDGFIIAGFTRPNTDVDDKDLLIVKVNNNGEVVWEKNYGYADADDEIYDLVVTASGIIALAGYTEVEENMDILLLKLSAEGDSISMAYTGKSSYEEVANSILSIGNTFYLGGSETGVYNNSDVTSYPYVIEWAGGFSIDLPYRITIEEGMNAEITDMVQIETNEIYMACNLKPITGSSSSIAVLRFNDGLKSKPDEKHVLKDDRYVTVSSMKYSADKIWLAGTTSNNYSGSLSTEDLVGNMFLASMNQQGTVKFLYYGDGVSYKGKGFDINTETNEYILTGAAFINDQSSIILTKAPNN